jgi:mannose-6-phosphate isomerase-like protein (cupin superfamily)
MLSRREACAALPAFLAIFKAYAQVQKTTLPSKIYNFDELPVRQSGSLTYRGLFSGKLFEDCQISLHESQLDPHSIPHPPHHHRHEEMVLVIDGTLEFTVNGKATRAGAGSALFAGSNEEHGIRNPDDTPARYFVFALGPENQ